MGFDAQYGKLVRSAAELLAEYPVIQAPMAGAGGTALAIAAIRGGGIGSLPCALLNPDEVIEQAATVRAAAEGPINLNFFCHTLGDPPDDSAWQEILAPYYAEYGASYPANPPSLRAPFDMAMAAVVEQVKPEIVSFHFGLPDVALLERVRTSAALVLSSATSVAEAIWLAEQGVEAVIAQGFEAGGHIGRFRPAPAGTETGLFALLPQIVDAIDLPVIAAGGVADERGIKAAFALGASAVQIGTAYLHTPEALITDKHLALLSSDAAYQTRFTNVISGGLARGLPNRLINDLGPINESAPRFPYASAALAELRKAAESRGRADFSTLWAGQSARLAKPEPAEELTRRLTAAARKRKEDP